MTKPLKISFDIKEFEKVANSLRPETLRRAALAGGEVIRGNAKVNVNEKFKTGHGDSGLAGTIQVKVISNTGTECVVEVGTTSNHGRIHELGGTIKPINGKFLAIPLNATAKKIESPKNYPGDLHFVGDSAGGVLADADGNAVYALKPSVTMPPRPFLRPAVDEHVQDISTAIETQVKIGIERSANGG